MDIILDLAYSLVAIAAIIFIVFLAFAMIVHWFNNFEYLVEQSYNRPITVSLDEIGEDIKRGNVSEVKGVLKKPSTPIIVQGIFNTKTNDFVEYRVIEANEVDQKIRNAHRSKKVAIWS
ncbi:hypothetical protein H6G04_34185 [Calothrix membranacea FACHB-236]|nr:hypothetical protein [Calothrix membranacea FACHB-236]